MESTDVTEKELARAQPTFTTEKSLVYRLVRFGWWVWFRLVHRHRVFGREHLPAEGACVIVANHSSFLDIPLIAASTRRHVCFVARHTLAKSRVIGFLIRHTGAVMVRRGTSDRAAIRDIVRHLELGDAVAIFPEGTRSADEELREFQRGMSLMARQGRAPIVPCAIRGTGRILPPGSSLPRPVQATIRYGPPLPPRATPEEARAAVQALLEASES